MKKDNKNNKDNKSTLLQKRFFTEPDNKNIGKLYIIPTPIGNLEDITLRAIRILNQVDLLLCEDTRVSSKLIQHLGIEKKLLSYHNFNEKFRLEQIVEVLNGGKDIGLVSDAGTPAISDPGFILVRHLIDLEIQVISLPGPVAFTTALVGSGLDTSSFVFLGFPPQKKGRQTFIKKLTEYTETKIMYESPHRINKLIIELDENSYSDRQICICRELTKVFEEYIRGSVKEVRQILEQRGELKGEICVILQ